MADRWAVATGNWSSTATWDGGTLPTASDDVYADGKTVTIDQNVTVLSIRTTQRSGGTAGGGFTLNAGVTVTANITVGTTNVLTANYATPGTSYVIGNITGYGAQFTCGIAFSGTGNLYLTGTVNGGSSNEMVGIRHTSGGYLSVTGNLIGTGTQAGGDPIRVTSTGTLVIIGNLTCSNASRALSLSGACNVTITGNITTSGTTAVIDGSSTPRVTLNGSITGSSSASAINHSGMTLIHNGNLNSITNGRMQYFVATYLIDSTANLQHTYRVNNAGVPGVERSLYTGGVNLNQPAVNNVRSGTVYGASNEFTGTCAVPPAGSVALGVPVDNTTGTAAIDGASIRAAIGLASANLDTQLSGIANDIDNITVDNAAIADAVWDEAYADHNVAGSFGKLLNTIRKANLAIEGVVSNAITPTTLTFSSNVSATTSAYAHAVLLFVSGPLAGENSPIVSYTSTNGVFVLEEPLTAAPSNGDEFVVVAASHVHSVAEIAAAIDINVAPFSATLPQRVQGTRVDVFYKEAIAITIAVFDESNDPVDLTTQGSLRVCIERRDGTDLQTIENANITIGGGDSNQFTFTCDATATGTLGQHYWSLRRSTNNEVLAHGQWQVLPAAFDT